jgi:chromosome segregation ATPase
VGGLIMSDNEIEEVLQELQGVRPEKLTDKAKRLFEAIMKIANARDKAESDLYEANNRINDLLDLVKQKDKRIADLEYSLLDMVLQFADEDKNSISTMGLSALETAFAELDLNDPMPIKEVHKLYKELAKKYFEERCK